MRTQSWVTLGTAKNLDGCPNLWTTLPRVSREVTRNFTKVVQGLHPKVVRNVL